MRQVHSAGGWWWLILERDGQALELVDTAPSRAEARKLATQVADARGWKLVTR